VSLSIKQLSQFSRSNQDLRAAHRKIQELQERIKRLEEAGDEMSHTCITIDADRWRTAKEAKP
jgi:uncharacterized protein Yka (UPF0111/DUF47 family)